MTMDQDELFALFKITRQQQEATELALRGLDAQRTELQKAAAALTRAAGDTGPLLQRAVYTAVGQALDGAGERTASALLESARPVIQKLNSFSSSAGEAEAKLKAASAALGWKWLVATALAMVILMGTTWLLAGLALTAELDELRALRVNAAAWQQQGGRAKLLSCAGRPCVQVNQAAGRFGKAGDTFILAGH
jgi:uncharacterized protein (DUF3084 family)